MKQDPSSSQPHKKRALVKALILIVLVILLAGGLWQAVNLEAVDELKHVLSLWSLVALVLLINLVSFITFGLLYLGYRWVRQDMKPAQDREMDLDLDS